MSTKKELLNQAIVLYRDLDSIYKCPYPDKSTYNQVVQNEFDYFISNENNNNFERIEKILRLNSCEKDLAILHLMMAFKEGYTQSFIADKMKEMVKYNPGDIKSKLHSIIVNKFWTKEYKVKFVPRRYIES